jgi:hypothetical protein
VQFELNLALQSLKRNDAPRLLFLAHIVRQAFQASVFGRSST